VNFTRIVVPKPPIGGKSYVLHDSGLFLLEEGPGLIWHAICHYIGGVGFSVWDVQRQGDDLVRVHKMFEMHPSYLGVWHLNAGFQHGLAFDIPRHVGTEAVRAPHVTPIWMAKSNVREARGVQRQQFFELKGHERRVVTPRDCQLYSVEIVQMGRPPVHFEDGNGNRLFSTPEGVNGSFVVEHVGCTGGLTITVDTPVAMSVLLVWYEMDAVPDQGL
jgi:hypothetical protein